MKRLSLVILGVFFILIGLVGLVVPIMPGWLLIFAGLSLIAPVLAKRLKRRFFRKFFKSEIIRIDEWKKLGADAGFTTRHLPLFLKKTDDLLDDSTQEKLKALFPMHQKFVFLNQVHGDRVQALEIAPTSDFTQLSETDGVITNIKELSLLVLTADCLPIYLIARDWIGLVHAGWRGTKAGIAKKALRLIVEKAGCKASEVHILFGPCIGSDHYEVGEEFKQFFKRRVLHSHHGKLYFDLTGENKRQLVTSGARLKNIDDHEICTACESTNFYSFRHAGDKAGRTISFLKKFEISKTIV